MEFPQSIQGFVGLPSSIRGSHIGSVIAGQTSARMEAFLAAIVQSSGDAIVGKTLEGIITSWNGAAERLYGYSAADVTGRPISIIVPPDRREELTEIMARLKRGECVPPFDTVRMRRDGRRIDVSVTISPIRDARGIVGASAIARDISDRKHAEAAERQAEALRAVVCLANAVAHEINNPLTVIMGHIDLLTGRPEVDRSLGAHLERIWTAIWRIADAVRSLGQLARLEFTEEPPGLPPMLDIMKSGKAFGQGRSVGSGAGREEPARV